MTFANFQARPGGGDTSVNADEVQAIRERHVIGGVYCELYLRGGNRVDVWGSKVEVERKLEARP